MLDAYSVSLQDICPGAIHPRDVDALANALATRLNGPAASVEPTRVSGTADGAISTWRRAALVCGTSEDTLLHWRKERGDTTVLPFSNAAECIAWYRDLRAGKTTVRRTPARRAPRTSTGGTTLADLRRKSRG